MQVLRDYEKQSVQKINTSKSYFYMFNKVALTHVNDVIDATGLTRCNFPLKYLGCPIGHTKKRKTDFSELIKKIQNKLQVWKGKLLSFGGKVVKIQHVLQSMPVYLLSAIIPPKCVIYDIHRIFAKFLWNFKGGGES